MTSTFTPNMDLEMPARGDYPNQWDLPANANYTKIDSAFGGTLSLSGLTGGMTVLTAAQANNKCFVLSGNLAANQVVAFPPIGGGQKYIFPNCALNGFGLYIRGNNGADQSGPYFLVQFAIPYGVLVTPGRVYWDYGSAPPGTLQDFPFGFVHPGWIPCDGRGANTTEQDLLFDLIGYSFGGGGATFNVPDFRGYVRPCADNIGTGSAGRLFNWGINAAGGESTHVLSVAELAYHTHADAGHGHAASQDAHSHGGVITGAQPSGGAFAGQIGGANLLTGRTDTQQPNVYIGAGYANIQAAGSNAAHNNTQPSQTVMTCIRW